MSKPIEIEKDKGPWYKFWGSDSPKQDVAPEKAATKAEPAKAEPAEAAEPIGESAKEPWYKFW